MSGIGRVPMPLFCDYNRLDLRIITAIDYFQKI